MVASTVRRTHLRIYPGDDRAFTWPVTDKDGEPMALTGWTVLAQVRPMLGGGVLHEWSTAAGNAVLFDSTVTLSMADSETWEWNHGAYDIHLTDTTDRTQVLDSGTIVVDRGVTMREG